MKKTLFFVALFGFLLPQISVGQETDNGVVSKPLKLGATLGGSISQFSQPRSIMVGSIGGFARYKALPFLEVQGGLNYSVTGGGRLDLERDLTLGGESDLLEGPIQRLQYINRHVYLHTVQIPISLRLSLPELSGAPIEPKFILGGSFSSIVKAMEKRDIHFEFENTTRILLSDKKENVTSDYDQSNLAIHGGLGLDFNLINEKVFSMEFLYHQGVTDLNAIRFGQPENIERLRTRGVSLKFSYSIF